MRGAQPPRRWRAVAVIAALALTVAACDVFSGEETDDGAVAHPEDADEEGGDADDGDEDADNGHAEDRFERLLVLLEDSGDAPIAVHGHTDNVGSREPLPSTSQERQRKREQNRRGRHRQGTSRATV